MMMHKHHHEHVHDAVDQDSIKVHRTPERPSYIARLKLADVGDHNSGEKVSVVIDAHAVSAQYRTACGRIYYFQHEMRVDRVPVAFLLASLYAVLLLFASNDALFDTQMCIVGVSIISIILCIFSYRSTRMMLFFTSLVNFIAQLGVFIAVCVLFPRLSNILFGLVAVVGAWRLLACMVNILDCYLFAWDADTFMTQLAEEVHHDINGQPITQPLERPPVSYAHIAASLISETMHSYQKRTGWFSKLFGKDSSVGSSTNKSNVHME